MQNNNIQKAKKFGLNLIVVFLWLILTFLAFNNYVFASDWGKQSGLDKTANKMGYIKEDKPEQATTNSPEIFFGLIIKSVLSFLGVVFLILIIYAGIYWMQAGGNQEKVDKAKDIIVNSIIGLAIVISAYAATYFIMNNFNVLTK